MEIDKVSALNFVYFSYSLRFAFERTIPIFFLLIIFEMICYYPERGIESKGVLLRTPKFIDFH
jgi:hypothetical protein